MREKPEKLIKLINAKAFCFALVLITALSSTSFGQSFTWQKVLNNNYGVLRKITQTSDGGYASVGVDRINNVDKLFLVKFNIYGNILWSKIIGIGYTEGYWLEETTDNGLIICGYTDSALGNSKIYLIKTDVEGNIEWHKTFSYSDLDQGICVKQTEDGGYIISCRTGNMTFIKTNHKGELIWEKTYLYEVNSGVIIHELKPLSTGYICAGWKQVSNQNSDAFLVKLNLQGDTMWTRKYGGSNVDVFNSIDLISDYGYIAGGSTKSFHGMFNPESYLVRTDTNGMIIWERAFGSNFYDECNSVRYKQNFGIITGGTSDSIPSNDVTAKIRIINLQGYIVKELSYMPNLNGYISSYILNLEQTDDNGFIFCGFAEYNTLSMYVFKTDSLLYSNPIGVNQNITTVTKSFLLSQNYPNPFNPTTNIQFDIPKDANVSIRIYDLLGREVFSVNEYKQAGSYEMMFDGSNLASGLYYYSIKAETSQREVYTETKKMVLIK